MENTDRRRDREDTGCTTVPFSAWKCCPPGWIPAIIWVYSNFPGSWLYFRVEQRELHQKHNFLLILATNIPHGLLKPQEPGTQLWEAALSDLPFPWGIISDWQLSGLHSLLLDPAEMGARRLASGSHVAECGCREGRALAGSRAARNPGSLRPTENQFLGWISHKLPQNPGSIPWAAWGWEQPPHDASVGLGHWVILTL